MGPNDIKQDIYNVMTSSRELTNYCQESVKSFQTKKISDSLDNFHLKTSVDFITKSLINKGQYLHLNEIDLTHTLESANKPIYNNVINYIESYMIERNS